MATTNPFDLLGDDDGEDPAKLISAAQKVAQTKKEPSRAQQPAKPAAKLPAKPLPPAQAVREAKTDSGRRGGRGGERGYGDRGFGRGGGGGGYNRDQPKERSISNSGFSGSQGGNEDADGGKSFERRGGYTGPPRGSFRGGRRGDFGNGEVGNEERPRRAYDRRSGTGRGYEVKREGAGRGNWGTATDEIITPETAEVLNEVDEKNVDAEKPLEEEEAADANKETPAIEAEEKEPQDKEMTLQEYEKVLEEKRKSLQALKTTEERKVDDQAFATMQALSNKKDNDEFFVKLGADKRKELAEKEEKAKKSLSINEFLKPPEGERYYGRSGRRGGGRGGRGPREGYGGEGSTSYHVEAPKIEDPGQFPVLGTK